MFNATQKQQFSERIEAVREHIDLADEGGPSQMGHVLLALQQLTEAVATAHDEAMRAQEQTNTLAMFS